MRQSFRDKDKDLGRANLKVKELKSASKAERFLLRVMRWLVFIRL